MTVGQQVTFVFSRVSLGYTCLACLQNSLFHRRIQPAAVWFSPPVPQNHRWISLIYFWTMFAARRVLKAGMFVSLSRVYRFRVSGAVTGSQEGTRSLQDDPWCP
jgi:hypothetical protein